MTERFFPALYYAADEAARYSQRKFICLAAVYNLSLVAVPAVTLFVNLFAWGQLYALIPLFISMCTSLLLIKDHGQKKWYESRALADSVKSAAWQFAMRARPYDCCEEVAEKRFDEVTSDLQKDHQSILIEMSGRIQGPKITSKMRKLRLQSVATRRQVYCAERVMDQERFYRLKGGINRRNGIAWSAAVILFTFSGLAVVASRSAWQPAANIPPDLFAVVAASAFSWMQTKRFSELAAAYGLTSVEISGVISSVARVETEEALRTVVDDSEAAFSREHTQWRVRRNCI